MVKSKTKISKQLQKKNDPELIEIILATKKSEKWLVVAGMLSRPRRKRIELNLDQIDKEVKEGDVVIVPGKVLSQGEVSKKIKIAAMSFSESARNKLLKAKCEVSTLKDEFKKNPEAKGIKILG